MPPVFTKAVVADMGSVGSDSPGVGVVSDMKSVCYGTPGSKVALLTRRLAVWLLLFRTTHRMSETWLVYSFLIGSAGGRSTPQSRRPPITSLSSPDSGVP